MDYGLNGKLCLTYYSWTVDAQDCWKTGAGAGRQAARFGSKWQSCRIPLHIPPIHSIGHVFSYLSTKLSKFGLDFFQLSSHSMVNVDWTRVNSYYSPLFISCQWINRKLWRRMLLESGGRVDGVTGIVRVRPSGKRHLNHSRSTRSLIFLSVGVIVITKMKFSPVSRLALFLTSLLLALRR